MAERIRLDRKRRRGVRALLLFLLLACLGGAAVLGKMGLEELAERRAGEDFYAQLSGQTAGAAAKPAEAPVSGATAEPMGEAADAPVGETAEPMGEATDVPVEGAVSEVDFDALRRTCPDAVGWLRIDGTIVDYPIVQGADNDFYLTHLADGTPNQSGSIMMDQVNDAAFGDMITILHGHNMRSGAMFGDLEDYKSEAYYREHPVIRLCTPDGDADVEVFAACTVNGHTFGYPTSFAEQTELEAFVRRMVSATPYETGVTVELGDRMLLLSTCAYSYSGARFIVLGRISDGTE